MPEMRIIYAFDGGSSGGGDGDGKPKLFAFPRKTFSRSSLSLCAKFGKSCVAWLGMFVVVGRCFLRLSSTVFGGRFGCEHFGKYVRAIICRMHDY